MLWCVSHSNGRTLIYHDPAPAALAVAAAVVLAAPVGTGFAKVDVRDDFQFCHSPPNEQQQVPPNAVFAQPHQPPLPPFPAIRLRMVFE